MIGESTREITKSTKEREAETQTDEDAAKYAKLFVFSGGHKAGMEAMDKERQAKVIYEMSKNSAFFKRAAKLDEATTHKAQLIKIKFDQIDEVANNALYRHCMHLSQQRCVELEKCRSFAQICCVLDMDMFYAAVEIRDQPNLKDFPVAVGDQAMICTSNYVARKYGVRAAMPGFIAKKLCPQLVFVPCNFTKYRVVAEQIRGVIAEYDPHFQSYSLDEVYFDLTSATLRRYRERESPSSAQSKKSLFAAPTKCDIEEEEEEEEEEGEEEKDPSSSNQVSMDILRPFACEILHEIRSRIEDVTNGLTCSAGIANNFFLAKICADVQKPNGQFELVANRQSVLDFLHTLPTRKVGGIGKVTEKILDFLDLHTMGDVRENAHRILHTFSPNSSEFLLRTALGIGRSEGQDRHGVHDTSVSTSRKSIGCERTYSAKGISQTHELFEKLHEICQSVSEDMRRHNLRGKCVTVKVKDTHFNLHTRCHSSATFNVQSAESIESLAKPILNGLLPMKIRLLGVSVSKFQTNSTGNESKSRNVLSYFQAQECADSKAPNALVGDSATENSLIQEDNSVEMEEHDVAFIPHSTDKEELVDLCGVSSDSELSCAAQAICPMCNKTIPGDRIAINLHVDRCLQPTQTPTKKQCIKSSSSKRKSNQCSKPIHSFFKQS